MILYLRALTFIFISFAIKGTVFSQYHYKNYLRDKQAFSRIREKLYFEKAYKDVIKDLSEIDCNYSNCRTKYNYLSKAYLLSGDTVNARTTFRELIKWGLPWSAVDSLMFAPIILNIRDSFDLWNAGYLSGIDTFLVSQIKGMYAEDQKIRALRRAYKKEGDSINLSLIEKRFFYIDEVNIFKLKKICEHFGWPGIRSVGQRVFSLSTDASIFAIHSIDISEKLFFLELIIDACLKGEEDWALAESLAGDLGIRFPLLPQRVFCFRLVQFDENRRVAENDRSLLEVKAIADRLKTNEFFEIELFPHTDDFNVELKNIYDLFLNFGLPKERIRILEDIKPIIPTNQNYCKVFYNLKY